MENIIFWHSTDPVNYITDICIIVLLVYTRVLQNINPAGFISYIPALQPGQQMYALNGGNWTKLGLGVTGEKWNDISGTRNAGVTYTNKYPYPIAVSLTATAGTANGYLSLHVDGAEVVLVSSYDPANTNDRYNTLRAIVPAGSNYIFRLPGGNSSLNCRSELY
jgi:hypothetical protein